MLINAEMATYLARVADYVESSRYEGPFTSRCPECSEDQNGLDHYTPDDNRHIVIRLTVDTVAVIVGCEGYKVIDPGTIGLPRGDWQLDAATTGVHTDDGPMARMFRDA